MPTLTWVGKDKVVNHHHDVPFRVLNKQYSFVADNSLPSNSTQNRIIHGDNLEALKSLLPEFEGKVKCIYIDPPYNTGNEGWVYNDNVSDPKIKKWLGQVVGKEGEDLSRHDKWLCMMYPRLKLLHKLLADDGVIFVSIDDDEGHSLRMLLDEIFGRAARLATFVWKTDGNFDNQAKIKNCHEYLLMYSKDAESFPYPPVVDPNTPSTSKLFKPTIRNTIVKNGIKNPITDIILPIGFPSDVKSGEITARNDIWPHYDELAIIENNALVNQVNVRSGWSSLDLLKLFIDNQCQPIFDSKGQETVFLITRTGAIEAIKTRTKPSHVITTLSNLGSTQSGSNFLAEIGIKFPYPKPVDLVSYLISMIDDNDFLVLDSFAGSGTTAHAVLKLNAQDGGNRRFILIEMMDYAENITAERVRRVINGYGQDNKKVAGLGGGFDYYTIGQPLFLDNDNLNEAVGINTIRDYITYSEGIPTHEQTTPNNPYNPYVLGLNREVAWVFFYEQERTTTLDIDFLGTLHFGQQKPNSLIVYADKCLLSQEFMRKYNIRFKKNPRDITRF